jgi:hypothetical protein
MAELTEVAEEVADVVEEAIDDGIYIKGWVGFVMTAVGAGVGAFVGYRVAQRRLRDEYAREAETEIDQMREHFRARLMVRESKPEITDLNQRVEQLGYASTPKEKSTEEKAAGPGDPNTSVVPQDIRNVFDTAQDKDHEWDYEIEEAIRAELGDRPHVIHVDERHETENEEITLTYYEGDDVLCDMQDNIIDNPDAVVGEANLSRFGHGSGDRNIVYIRNPVLHTDIEVCLSTGTYAEEVHGLKHSDVPPRRRRRSREE